MMGVVSMVVGAACQGNGRGKYGGGRRVRVMGVVSMVVSGVCQGAERGKCGGGRGVRVLGVAAQCCSNRNSARALGLNLE